VGYFDLSGLFDNGLFNLSGYLVSVGYLTVGFLISVGRSISVGYLTVGYLTVGYLTVGYLTVGYLILVGFEREFFPFGALARGVFFSSCPAPCALVGGRCTLQYNDYLLLC
jgi:hypothetical protein